MPDPSRRARHLQDSDPWLGKYPRSFRLGLLGAGLAATVAVAVTLTTAQPDATAGQATAELNVGDLPQDAIDTADLADLDLTARSEIAASRFEVREELAELVVDVDGETIKLTTAAERVSEALAEAGIVVDEHDVVSVPLGEHVVDGLELSISRVSVDEVREVETDEYETVEENDSSLAVGQRRVVVEGVDGVTVSVYREFAGDEDDAERELIARSVLSERVDEVVRVGTRQPVTSTTGGSGSGSSTSGGSGGSGGTVSASGNRGVGQELAAERGWTGEQWTCLDQLWQRESNWNHLAQNSSSGAYGIPQSLPGSKMASVGSDWQTNPATQITWGLNYISGRYGTPCGAWSHSQQRGWY